MYFPSLKIIESEFNASSDDSSPNYLLALSKLDRWLVYLNRRERHLIRPLIFCSESSVNFNIAIDLFCRACTSGALEPLYYTLGDFGEVRLLAETERSLQRMIRDPIDENRYGTATEEDIYLGFRLLERPIKTPEVFDKHAEGEVSNVDLKINGGSPEGEAALQIMFHELMNR